MTQSQLVLPDPAEAVDGVVAWLQGVFARTGKTKAVIAISGGIDSALSLTLLSQALNPSSIYTLLLPYGDQDITDGKAICDFNEVPEENCLTLPITSIVDSAWQVIPNHKESSELRRGNLMARSRMMLVFDRAKELDALVCGTENKSEHWLGYWTRFGDAASDIEPISLFYKTQVRQLASYLGLPAQFLTKAPSAGLWAGQTDEVEMGFSYGDADIVLQLALDEFYAREQRWPMMEELDLELEVPGVEPDTVQRVLSQVKRMHFKHEVPYYPAVEESYA